jgi:hypothetical protein
MVQVGHDRTLQHCLELLVGPHPDQHACRPVLPVGLAQRQDQFVHQPDRIVGLVERVDHDHGGPAACSRHQLLGGEALRESELPRDRSGHGGGAALPRVHGGQPEILDRERMLRDLLPDRPGHLPQFDVRCADQHAEQSGLARPRAARHHVQGFVTLAVQPWRDAFELPGPAR